MKQHLRLHFILVAILFALISCQKKKEDKDLNSGQSAPAPVPSDYSLHCEEHFTPTWCGMNREISQISEICVGQLALEDETVEALSLKDSATKCYAFSGHSTDVTFSGCAVARKNGYVGDLQGADAMEATVCYSQGRPAYVEGSSPSGELFKSFHIE